MEASNIPLNKWLMAIYICTAHKKGISSYQLGKDIGVAQKTAWFMLHRIREMIKPKDSIKLTGIVEIDETYLSRKYGAEYKAIPPEEIARMEEEGYYHQKKKNKGAAIAMKERGGDIIVKAAFTATAEIIGDAVKENVEPNTHLMTDEATKYRIELADFKRESVNHSKKEWVRGNVHTNGVENFWSVMKRGVYGIYHQISYKHLQHYCDEFSYRYNSRKLKDNVRFENAIKQMEGRLDYKTLIGK